MSFLKKSSFAVCAAIGEGCAALLTAVLLFPAAWAVSAEAATLDMGSICAFIVSGLSVSIPTAVIARVRGREALATAGAIGGGYILIAAVLCALGGPKNAYGPWLGYLSAAVVVGALAGALLSVRQNKHKKRRR